MLQICSCFHATCHYMCILLGLSLRDPWMPITENTDLQCQSSKSISNPVQIVLSRIMQPIKDSKAWKMRIRRANASSSKQRGSLGHWSEIEKFGQHVWESMIAHFYRKIKHYLLLSKHCLQVDGLETPQWTFSNLQNPLRPFFAPSRRVFNLSKHGIATSTSEKFNEWGSSHQALAYTCLFKSRREYLACMHLHTHCISKTKAPKADVPPLSLQSQVP